MTPPPSSTGFFGHPRGLSTLFFTEMWERFTYYGMRALLVLFLVDAVQKGGFGLDDRTATAIYGLYTAGQLLFALPGGWIADRLIGAQQAVIWGAVLIIAGNTVLAIPGVPGLFYLGLLVIAFGVGLLKPNVSAIVASLYPEGGARRDAGFTIFYVGINVGAFIGPLIAAWLAAHYGWRIGFLSAAVGMAIGLLQFQLTRRHLGHAGLAPQTHAGEALDADSPRNWYPVLIGVGIVGLILALTFSGVIAIDPKTLARSTVYMIIGVAAAYFAYLLLFAGLDTPERKRILVVLVLFIACALFWSGFEQAGSSLNLFAERYTDRRMGGWEIPAGWFQSLNAIFVVTLAPLFSALWVMLARRNLDPSAPAKFAIGLITMGIGFLVMVAAAKIVATGSQVLPYWLVLTYLLHTMGELCLSPVGLSSVTKLAPQRFVGQIMGVWFLAISLGNLLAGLIAGEFDDKNLAAMPGQYLSIVTFSVGSGLFLLLISPFVRKLMGGVK